MSVLEGLLSDTGLNEDQRLRVWKQIERRIETEDKSKLTPLLTIAINGPNKVAKAAMDSKELISNRFVSVDERQFLARELLKLVSQSRSLAVKNQLVAWSREVGNDGVLNRLLKELTWDLEDLRLLSSVYSTNRALKKALQEKEH